MNLFKKEITYAEQAQNIKNKLIAGKEAEERAKAEEAKAVEDTIAKSNGKKEGKKLFKKEKKEGKKEISARHKAEQKAAIERIKTERKASENNYF